ncbi:hypothetical protein SUGI_1102430 [Cryptomeria japonica]|nr:hypothetical protein SUGI_1102430 [Cryptomeria japonica]
MKDEEGDRRGREKTRRREEDFFPAGTRHPIPILYPFRPSLQAGRQNGCWNRKKSRYKTEQTEKQGKQKKTRLSFNNPFFIHI